MYQRYNGGNADEGWTRLVFEQWNLPYTSLFDPELKGGNLAQKYDVIILPSDNPATLVGRGGGAGRGAVAASAPSANPQGGLRAGPPRRIPTRAAAAATPCSADRAALAEADVVAAAVRAVDAEAAALAVYPPEFRSGFGDEGVKALQEFVQAGGTLVTFADAGALAIERFQLPVRDVVAGLPFKQFWSPGSTLKITVDTTNPLGYGMPSSALAIFLAGSQAYEVLPAGAQTVQTIAKFADQRRAAERMAARRAGDRWESRRWCRCPTVRDASCSSGSALSIARRRMARTSCCSMRS